MLERRVSGASQMNLEVTIDAEYVPEPGEPFMCERQKKYFRGKLIAWKESILNESRETLVQMQEETHNIADLADRASAETDRALELRTRDRQRKLISKIDAAIRRIDEGTYGYCEETGEPISLKRLNARPIATLSLHERREKVHRDT
jgi:DnaK suppressor protein